MILDLIEGPINGDSWETLCTSCYRMKYQEEHFTEIPAAHGGDAGIEGFTQTGIVYQCYCPEREYSENDLYNHLRDKMSDDIGKILKKSYAKRLKELGVPPIKEWHFVIPFYKDLRIIKHAESKRIEVLRMKQSKPQEFDYISDNFKILIKIAEDFRIEITRIIRTALSDVKLNFTIQHPGTPDWKSCDSEKVNNIKRKVQAVMGNIDDDESFNELVDMYVEAYIQGLEILRILRVSYTEVYEDIFVLEQAYKKQVALRTKMNNDSSINSILFNEILADFEQKLITEFKYLNMASILELKTDLISGWLADCSMQFKSR